MTASEKHSKELARVAEEMTMKELSTEQERHSFSVDYTYRKQAFLKKIQEEEQGKRRKHRQKRLLIAAVGLLIGVPTTAFAAKQLYDFVVKKDHYQVKVSVKEPSDKPNADTQFYKLTMGYMPKTMSDYHEEGMKYWYEDNYGQGGFSFRLWKVVEATDFFENYVGDFQAYTFEDKRAIVTTAVTDERDVSFDRHAYMLFEKEGFVLEAFIGSDVPTSDLEQVLANMTLEPTTEEDATHYQETDQLLKEGEGIYQIDVKPLPKDSPRLVKMGEKVSMSGFNYTIEKVEVRESISDLVSSDFSGKDEWMREQQMIDEVGNLLPYERRFYQLGDGKQTLDEVIDRQMIQPKFVYVTATFESLSNHPIEGLFMQNGVTLLTETAKGWLPAEEDVFYEPVSSVGEVDYLDSHGDGTSFYRLPTFEPREKRTIHLGYFVEESQLSQMFINPFYYGGPEDGIDDLGASDRWWIDIRQ